MSMHNSRHVFLPFLILMALSLAAAVRADDISEDKPTLVERGRHLIQVSGCNDCHTAGYIFSDGKVPVKDWLKGDAFGWRGPWGTTYATNLRLFVKGMSEAQWVTVAKTLKRRPPMPWFNLNAMHEDELRAIYQFIRSLGDPGEPAPAYVPPDMVPPPPYAQFPSPPAK